MPDSHRDDGYDENRWDAVYRIARDGPRQLEEDVYRRTLASLNNGWLARGGHLRLHADRLTFTPSPVERLLLARPHRVDFADITAVERHPSRKEDLLPGGMAPRLRVLAGERRLDFVFHNGLDEWIEAIEERRWIWSNRRRFDDDDDDA